MQIFAVISLILKFWNEVSAFVTWLDKTRYDHWVQNGNTIANQLEQAKTDDERRALLHRLVDHDKSIP